MFSDTFAGITEACSHPAVRITNSPFSPLSDMEKVAGGRFRHGSRGQVFCLPSNNLIISLSKSLETALPFSEP